MCMLACIYIYIYMCVYVCIYIYIYILLLTLCLVTQGYLNNYPYFLIFKFLNWNRKEMANRALFLNYSIYVSLLCLLSND